MDSFFIRWHGTKHSALALKEQISRFEQLARAQDELPDTEIALIESTWIRWAGTPSCLKTDASGSHMSEAFLSWADGRGIRLVAAPRDAHYKLGSMEHAHAVRRTTLARVHAEDPSLDVDKAINYAAEQRNRLRTVHGSSPSSIVFGTLPAAHGLSDGPFSPAAGDHDAQAANQQALAAKAFHEANSARALRTSFLARGPQNPASFQVGSYVYYFRAQTLTTRAASSLQRDDCEDQPSFAPSRSAPTSKMSSGWPMGPVWHERGNFVLNFPSERARRLLQSPASEATVPVMARFVRGPVRSLDLLTRPSPTIAGDAELDDYLDKLGAQADGSPQ